MNVDGFRVGDTVTVAGHMYGRWTVVELLGRDAVRLELARGSGPARLLEFNHNITRIEDLESPMKGVELIAAERMRQVDVHGYEPWHDARHHLAEFVYAATAYMHNDESKWPWTVGTFKPSQDHRRNLVKAGALIAAAIDVFDAPKDFSQ